MKVMLSPEAQEAVNSILARVKGANNYAKPSASKLVCQSLVDYSAMADANCISNLAGRLLSPQQRRKALLKKLAALTQGDGKTALEILEKSVRKLDRKISDNDEKEAEK